MPPHAGFEAQYNGTLKLVKLSYSSIQISILPNQLKTDRRNLTYPWNSSSSKLLSQILIYNSLKFYYVNIYTVFVFVKTKKDWIDKLMKMIKLLSEVENYTVWISIYCTRNITALQSNWHINWLTGKCITICKHFELNRNVKLKKNNQHRECVPYHMRSFAIQLF